MLINIAMPEKPAYAMQIEGRIFRVGNKSNAIIRYLSTGTDMEKNMFASTIGGRAETVENIALGSAARGLRDSFSSLFMETLDGSWERRKPGHPEEGTGGKEMDKAARADLSDWQRAVSYYFSNQKKNSKNKAQEGKDYFATPEPIGLKMVEWLGLKPGDSVLEPSAGHGAISRWFSPNTNNTIVEPSSQLAPLAQMVTPDAKVVTGTFENFNIVNKFDGISQEDTPEKTAVEHIAKAYRHLKDGGRLIAILPEGPSADKHFNKWLFGENAKGEEVQESLKEAVLTGEIHLPAATFGRAGTGVATRIVVVDKQLDTARQDEAYARAGGGRMIDLRSAKDVNELFERMEHMTMPERVGKEESRNENTESTEKAEAKESTQGTENQNQDTESRPGEKAAGREVEEPIRNEPAQKLGETMNFTGGEFTHTKTGEKIPQAKLKDKVDADTYKKLNTLAKNHDGYYSRYSKSFLFKDAAKRDEFMKVAEATLAAKFSAKGLKESEIRRMMMEAEPIANSDLTSSQRKLSDLGDELGSPVVWVKADPRLNGWHQNGVTFLNVNGQESLEKTFWHEIFHWIKANNEEDFQEILSYIQETDRITPEQIQKWKDKTGRHDLSDDDVIVEMLCDSFYDSANRVKEFRTMANNNPSLTQRIIAWVKRLMERYHEIMHGREGGLTTSQRSNMVRVLGKLAATMKDGRGEPIFRVRNEGKEIRLASGQPLPAVAFSAAGEEKGIDNSENKGDNKDREESVSDSKLSDSQKTQIFRNVARNIDSHIREQVRQGNKLEDILPELTSDNSSHKYNLFSRTRAQLQDLKNHINDDTETKRRRILNLSKKDPAEWSKQVVDETYQKMIDELQEVLNYGRVLYNEIALDRRRNQGMGGTILSWQSAEAQRAKRNAEAKLKAQKKQNTQQASTRNNASASSMPKASANLNEDNTPEHSFLDRIFERFGKSAGIKAGKIITEERARSTNDIGCSYYFRSPSRIAEKVKMFRLFYHWGDNAMSKLTKLRSDYSRKLEEAFDLVKNKEDRDDLFNILLIGDAEGKEYTKQQLIDEEGASENVAEAYVRIRRLMTKAYRMVNEASRRPQMHSRRMTETAIRRLRDNQFVEIKHVGAEDENGQRLVTYKEYSNWESSYTVPPTSLKRFYDDENMQVLDRKENEDGTFTVKVREGRSSLNRLTGYIPHFFHDYMIRIQDKQGYVATIGSGKTQKEAVEKAEEWLKNNQLEEGQKIYISPKVQNFSTAYGMDEGQYGVIMGDTDFEKMVESIARNNDMTLDEAKELVRGSARMKNRHRFFGNTLQRKGVEGYEQDLNWVLRHYFNSASRYSALETEFKPKAISLFERLFGDFNKDHKGLAKYTKDYINDVNGNPTALEETINNTLNQSAWWRKHVVSHFGDRAALQLSSSITNWTSMLCLGYLNMSSALLNLSQAINAAGYLGSVESAGSVIYKGFKRKYSLKEMRILMETNVMNDIGLDSGSGYDINRSVAGRSLGAFGWVSRKGMAAFKLTEGAMRRGTVLAAYEKAISEGKPHAAAIAYAKEINRKTNFDYGVTDAPNIFRRGSVISQLALQFKKYTFKELEVMADMLPMFSDATNSKQKMVFWGMYFLACGLLQVPMVDWLDDLLGMRGVHMKDFIQRSIMEASGDSWIGKMFAKTAMYGLPAVAGVDMSNRAGMAGAISMPKSPTDVLGPAGSKTVNFAIDAADAIFSNGSGANALRDVSPGLYNIYAAASGGSVGSRGRVVSKYDSFYDRALRAAGFKSTSERIATDIQRITYNEKDKITKEKQVAIDAYIDDPSPENLRRIKELGIKPETVKKERERKKLDRKERLESGMSAAEKERNNRMLKFAE